MFDGAMPFIVNKRFTKKMNSNRENATDTALTVNII